MEKDIEDFRDIQLSYLIDGFILENETIYTEFCLNRNLEIDNPDSQWKFVDFEWNGMFKDYVNNKYIEQVGDKK